MKFGFESPDEEKSKFGYGRKEPQRFRLRIGESKELVFIDDVPARSYEHSVKIDGYWKNFTCLETTCPLCDIGNKSHKVFYLTAIDLTPWEDKNGQLQVENYTLFCFKKRAAEALSALKQKHGRLKGLKFRATRGNGEYSASSGDHFEFIEVANELLDRHKEIDYQDVFQKLNIKQMYEVANESKRS